MKKEDSLKKRYFAKLVTNFATLFINLGIQAIVPRALGPKVYGDFHFLSNFFAQVANFFDMGTSTCFYTKLSQRQSEFTIVSFYSYFFIIASIFLLLLTNLCQFFPIRSVLWPNQNLFYIYLASVFGVLSWLTMILQKIIDAYGITVRAEIFRICQNFLGLIVICTLFYFKRLNLTMFFAYHYFMFFILGIGFFVFIIRHKHFDRTKLILKFITIKKYIIEFYNYSHPLFIYSLIGLIAGILDRWLLQYFAGSLEQGFYGLSYQIGAVCFLFSSAMTPLIMREFSIAFAQNNLTEMARLFRRYVPMLYAIASYFACFTVIQASRITVIFGGYRFSEAALPVAIMAFYPIHQTYGQLSGSVFMATGQTKLYRNIGILFMLLGLPITYFLIAPKNFFGLNAGATGLALKMVAFNIIAVNVQLFFNSKLLKLNYYKYIGHQVLCVFCLLFFAYVTSLIADTLITNDILSFFTAGIFYTIVVAIVVYCFPILFGLKKERALHN